MMLLMMLETEYGAQALSTVCDADILNIAKGEPDAVHILYEKTHKSLYGFILAITKDPHDAEDALQETYLAELDKDDGKTVYEVSFKKDGVEYDYEIDAASGKIIEYDAERD